MLPTRRIALVVAAAACLAADLPAPDPAPAPAPPPEAAPAAPAPAPTPAPAPSPAPAPAPAPAPKPEPAPAPTPGPGPAPSPAPAPAPAPGSDATPPAPAAKSWDAEFRDRVLSGDAAQALADIEKGGDKSESWQRRRDAMKALADQHARIVKRLNDGPQIRMHSVSENSPGMITGAGPDGIQITADGDVLPLPWGSLAPAERIRLAELADPPSPEASFARGLLAAEVGLPAEARKILEGVQDAAWKDRAADAAAHVASQPTAKPPESPPANPPGEPPTRPPAGKIPIMPPANPANPPGEPPANPPDTPPTNPPANPPGNPPSNPPDNPPANPPDAPPPENANNPNADAALEIVRKKLAAGDAAGAAEALKAVRGKFGSTPWFTPDRKQEVEALEARCEAILKDKARWTSLFDGTTLNGYSRAAGDWQALKGTIQIAGGSANNSIWRPLPDAFRAARYTLSVDFVCQGPAGIGLSFAQAGQEKWVLTIQEDAEGRKARAAFDLFKSHRWAGFSKAEGSHAGAKKDRWNELQVRVNGEAVEGWLNGTKVVACELPKLACGDVGLVFEARSGAARFQNFRLRED